MDTNRQTLTLMVQSAASNHEGAPTLDNLSDLHVAEAMLRDYDREQQAQAMGAEFVPGSKPVVEP